MQRAIRNGFLGFLAWSVSGPALADDPATIPIRRVVIYKHGLGYFERQGPVTGEASIVLRFKQDQMSDVLKTLTVLDRGGGRIAAIAYDSQKPASQVLAEFAFDLRTDNVQLAVLRQLRGARVRVVAAGSGPLSGSVLGLDERVERRDGTEVRVPVVSLLTDDGAIVSADLFDLRLLQFEDAALAAEISRYLEVLRSTHRRDEKAVELVCAGEGERNIFAAYAVEQPVWKATYRLVVGERQPFLQGWAVVDNTSDDDWVDVELSLVSGLPVSFRQDLYTPRFRERPEVSMDEDTVLDVDELADLRPSERRKAAAPEPAGAARLRADERAKFGADRPFEAELAEAGSEAETREIGELLEYRIDHPVTILRNRSALLPIVAAPVEGGKVALYNEAARERNPLSAVRIENTTGLTLEGGPLTVLEGETYAGESPLETLKPGEKRYVAYAVDLGVKATTKLDSRRERVHRVAFVRGTMISRYEEIERKTYSFDNKDDAPRTVVIEHPRRNGYRLRAPDAAFETELDRYRFRVEIAAATPAVIVVEESLEREGRFAIQNVDDATIALFLEQGILNDEAEAMLRSVVDQKEGIVALEQAIQMRRAQFDEIGRNQDRIRRNLQALGQSNEEKDLRRAYVEQLKNDEETVSSLTTEIKEIEQKLAIERGTLDRMLQEFILEYALK